MIKIPCTRGYEAIVDDEDIDLSNHKWSCLNIEYPYAKRGIKRKNYNDGKYTIILMHRVILERMIGRPLQINEMCDHANGNILDNRRANLRNVNKSINSINAKKMAMCSSIYKGVNWSTYKSKWRAFITLPGKHYKHLGYFDSEYEAALIRDEFAKKIFGEYTKLNFPKYEVPP